MAEELELAGEGGDGAAGEPNAGHKPFSKISRLFIPCKNPETMVSQLYFHSPTCRSFQLQDTLQRLGSDKLVLSGPMF